MGVSTINIIYNKPQKLICFVNKKGFCKIFSSCLHFNKCNRLFYLVYVTSWNDVNKR